MSSARALLRLVVLGLGVIPVVGGCAGGDILVAPVRKPLGVYPAGAPFHITRRAAPRGAMLVATVSFETSPAHAEATLNDLRDRAREAGGNLVAHLRCTGEGIFLLPGKGNVGANIRVRAATVRCEGRIYRIPLGSAPRKKGPDPGQIESL
jgi:hypothetical protein